MKKHIRKNNINSFNTKNVEDHLNQSKEFIAENLTKRTREVNSSLLDYGICYFKYK